VASGTNFSNELINWIRKPETVVFDSFKRLIKDGLMYILESDSSEDVASYLHFLLTTSPVGKPTIPQAPEEAEDDEEDGSEYEEEDDVAGDSDDN